MSKKWRPKSANVQIHRWTELKLENLKLNLRSGRSMFIVDVISWDAKKKERGGVETQSAPFPNRPILLVHPVSIRKRFLSLLAGLELRTLFRKVGYYRPTRRSCSERALSKRVVLFRPLSFPRRSLHPLLGSLHLLFLPTFFFYYRPTLDVEMIFRGFAFPWRWYRTVRGINTDRLQPRP